MLNWRIGIIWILIRSAVIKSQDNYPYLQLKTFSSEIYSDSKVRLDIITPFENYWYPFDYILILRNSVLAFQYQPINSYIFLSTIDVKIQKYNFGTNLTLEIVFQQEKDDSTTWDVLYQKDFIKEHMNSFKVNPKPPPRIIIGWRHYEKSNFSIKEENDKIIIFCKIVNFTLNSKNHFFTFKFPKRTVFKNTIFYDLEVIAFVQLKRSIFNRSLICTFSKWTTINYGILTFKFKNVPNNVDPLSLKFRILFYTSLGIFLTFLCIVFVVYFKELKSEKKLNFENVKTHPSILKRSYFQAKEPGNKISSDRDSSSEPSNFKIIKTNMS